MKLKRLPCREVRDSKRHSAILQGQPCNVPMIEPHVGMNTSCAPARFATSFARWWSQNHRALHCEGFQRRHSLADATTGKHPRMLTADFVRGSQANHAAMGMNRFLQQCDGLFV